MASAHQAREFPLGGKTDFTLREHEQTEPFGISEPARQALETEVNGDRPRLELLDQREDQVRLRATEHVGIVSLPDGPTVEIQPKVPGTDLLALLRYAHSVEASTVEQRTSLTAGRTFIEALAALYNAELDTALEQGLHRDYRRTQATESHLRGRLDVARQLQRQGVAPTNFECTYDELTADTTVNRAILYATALLGRLVRDRALSQALHRHRQQLRRHVTLTPVRPAALEGMELNRLSAHYTDLLRLTKLVLRSVYIEELRSGARASFALLVNMNEVFEAVVEQAVSDAMADRSGWSVEGQASSQSLITGGKRSVTIRPDVLVRDENSAPALVGDAK